jgi:hypothetical protein
MVALIICCLVSFGTLVRIVRRGGGSLGLPIAYLFLLLMAHLPGAYAHVVGRDFLLNYDLDESAMRFTAVASVCFVFGVWWARSGVAGMPVHRYVDRRRFWLFCLIGGWIAVFGLIPFYDIPSFNAVGEKGGAIWLLGVLLALRTAFEGRDFKEICLWGGALMVFPVSLLAWGFLGWGSVPIVIVSSALAVSIRSPWRVALGIILFTYLSLSVFVTYFQHREEIRNKGWSGAPLSERIDSVVDAFVDFHLFDPSKRQDLVNLDERLNQNYFVGLAARRIERGQVAYLNGESLWEGLIALVPRVFWPEKPVYGGSPQIVSKMTGLHFNSRTSIGVGNIMELQINFGYPGVVVGFCLLGWGIGKLDLKAAIAEYQGELGTLILYFLPCLAMIQPNGSIVEISGGSAAALVAAYLWHQLWTHVARGVSLTGNRQSPGQLPTRTARTGVA